MNRLLIATLLALATPAYAGSTIPAAFHGEWCMTNGVYFTPAAKSECGADSWVKVTANSFDGHEQKCKPVSVAKDPSQDASLYAYIIKFKCEIDEPGKVDITRSFWRTPETYRGVRHVKRLYIEEKTK